MRGRFISLEGGEGAGKSTQGRALAAALARAGLPVLRTREPGGSAGAEAIRALLLGRGGWDPVAEMTLHFAARREHWASTIAPALQAGIWVVCDRFFDSTLAYQVGGQGAPRETWAALRAATLGEAAPDLTLLLDLPVAAGLARAQARGEVNRYDALGQGFHERVRASFLAQAAEEPARFAVLDATRPAPEVLAAMLEACRQRLGAP
ncbi:dTMP kinase [Roseococcus suduntuyensis]|uniref:Thymidylate kinase n=1 Tax=Roseococcus suduntuyensis TaxID=455361 RepID=A0A840AAW6_9PROT|nr:dTMP kinase [Roseococcus suduntuyensis]MBB3898689.1 dTMP kinase [Roseococcus suduntuyensis]